MNPIAISNGYQPPATIIAALSGRNAAMSCKFIPR